MEKITVNAVGEACPIPVVKANKAMQAMKEAGTLEVLVDNDPAVQNLNRMAAGHHFSAKTELRENGVRAVIIDVTGPVKPIVLNAGTMPVTCHPPAILWWRWIPTLWAGVATNWERPR